MRKVRLSPSLADLLRCNDQSADEPTEIEVPDDLTAVSDEELEQLSNAAKVAFDEEYKQPRNAENIARLGELAEVVEKIKVETDRRKEEAEKNRKEADELRAKVHGSDADEEDGGEGEGGDSDGEGDEPEGDEEPEGEPEPAPTATEDAPESLAAGGGKIKLPAVPKRKQVRLNIPSSEIRKHQPKVDIPEQHSDLPLAITASADIPGFARGVRFQDRAELAEAFYNTARRLPVTAMGDAALEGAPALATIANEFEHVLEPRMSPEEVDAVLKAVTEKGTTAKGLSEIVAAGGWCAPSEIRYDFFNVVCDDGMIDLPTVGIQRGGIRWPVSPTLNDFFTGEFTNATNPWLWTETDDIAAVTGSPTKPCIRIECPDFDEARLECYGLCLIAGNLTDNAYPEITRNTLRLLMSAMFHVTNQRYIQTLVGMAGTAITGGFFDEGSEITSDVLAAAEWAAVDYKYRYGMCENDVLELILPFWLKPIVRASMSRRTGIEAINVLDAQINDWFDARKLRVQWVKDYQVRGTNQPGGASPTLAYPTTVEFLLYAPGTVVLGNGMSLDLGVVRDSVLNETNDHTAAWSEECHLMAQLGHSVRRYSVAICAGGQTGAADIVHCGT